MKVAAFLLATVILCATQARVLLVIDVIRSGARAPASNSSFFPNITWELGEELTPVGERQECLLGRLRRQQYIETTAPLLPSAYDPTAIYVRSTDRRRSLMSAQAYLIGLYPTGLPLLNGNQTAHAHDLLRPPVELSIGDDIIDDLKDNAMPFNLPVIPIHSTEYSAETLLQPNNCPYIDAQLAKYYSSSAYRRLITDTYLSTWKSVVSAYPEITLEYLLTNTNAYALADFLVCAAGDGRRPAGLDAATVEELGRFLGSVQKAAITFSPLVAKLWLTHLVHEVLQYMNHTVQGAKKPRYVVYSAHSTTLTSLLAGMKQINNSIATEKQPTFASNLLFELEEGRAGTELEHTVAVYFNGELIHREPYESFGTKFSAVGELGMSREQACRTVPVAGLRGGRYLEFINCIQI